MAWPKIEYLGWGTFGILSLIFSAPFSLLFYLFGSEELHPIGLVIAGICAGSVVAAVATAAGNSLLQGYLERRGAAALEAADRDQAQRRLERKLRRKEKKQQRAKR